MKSLQELGALHGTDKGPGHHNYVSIYAGYLDPARTLVNRVLEIGVFRGDSIRMWRDYFPDATIHGADTNLRQASPTGERTVLHEANQGDPAALKKLAALGPFDVIVDDGSHYADHQILAFETLFPALQPGGLYFCEDIHAQLRGFPGARPPTGAAIDHFTRLAFHIQADVGPENADDNFDRESVRDYWQRAVEFVHFHRYLVAVRMRHGFDAPRSPVTGEPLPVPSLSASPRS